MNATANWDLLITGATVFDGSGEKPSVQDVAVAAGRIVARDAKLAAPPGTEVYNAAGKWLMPGLLDIHTHLDLEVELDAGLAEVVRHGTTTAIFGNCSIGMAFGAQRRNGEDPILDCFARVENIPKSVLKRCVDHVDWHAPHEYLQHLDTLSLGPNVTPLLPHSMLRIDAMGIQAAIERQPSEAELVRMEASLESAMRAGYIGFSTDNIPFHYLANEPNTDARIPSPHAKPREHRRLLNIVRRYDRVWQATPDAINRLGTLTRFLYTSGRLFGRPLRTTALTAIDLAHDRQVWKVFLKLARTLNSKWLDGHFHFQVLGTPFYLFCEGSVTPIFEEFRATRPLLACDVEDVEGRRRILSNEDYIKQFEADWSDPKVVSTFQRDLEVINIDETPVAEWNGETVGAVFRRLQSYQSGNTSAARSAAERSAFEACKKPIGGEAAFFLHLLREYDRAFHWHLLVGNDRPEVLEELLFDEHCLPGFNDSGAHLINLAFFDGNLATLQIAQRRSLERVAQAVKRLTREPADFFGLDVGTLNIGAQADITIIDPGNLASYDTNANRQVVYRGVLGEKQLVNRSDGVVDRVYIAGTPVWENDHVLRALGTQKLGRALRYSERA